MQYSSKTKKSDIRKVANAWQTVLNPLRGLTQTGIAQLIDQVKRGNDVRLQIAFKEIEQNTPIYCVCINKRLAGITSRKWDIIPLDESPEAKAQAETVKNMFLKSDTRNLDGLTEALRHLGMASFRGRSAVKPFVNENGDLYFKRLDNWNVLEWNDRLYWNPDADQMFSFRDGSFDGKFKQIPDEEVVWVKEERPIDIPGLSLYLRQLIGEENWARATEKYGVAQVILTAPDGTPDSAIDVWNSRAVSIFEGGSGVLPPGSKVDQLTDARGQDPFSEYINHQMRMICILAVGSTSSVLGDVGSGLGSDVATKQDDQFQSLITNDCRRISNAMTQCAVMKCVRYAFPGKDVRCRFSFVEEDHLTPKEYMDLAQQAQTIGITIDIQKLRDLTGLQFIKEDIKDVWKPTETE